MKALHGGLLDFLARNKAHMKELYHRLSPSRAALLAQQVIRCVAPVVPPLLERQGWQQRQEAEAEPWQTTRAQAALARLVLPYSSLVV